MPPLVGGARDGEALCKGSEDVAALDIVSCPLEGALVAAYMVMPVWSSRPERTWRVTARIDSVVQGESSQRIGATPSKGPRRS